MIDSVTKREGGNPRRAYRSVWTGLPDLLIRCGEGMRKSYPYLVAGVALLIELMLTYGSHALGRVW